MVAPAVVVAPAAHPLEHTPRDLVVDVGQFILEMPHVYFNSPVGVERLDTLETVELAVDVA
jgi:hypothetical protein